MARWLLVALDIDGTLINLAGPGSRAMDIAFRQFLKLDESPRRSSFAGRTDLAIVREVLATGGVPHPVSDEALDRLFELYIELLPGEIAKTPYRVTPGSRELISMLEAMPRTRVGVATGNVIEAARIKLRSAGLQDRYDFGAYGRDVEMRDDLLRTAFERGAATLPTEADEWVGVVLGDTPHDISGAHAVGAKAVAVAQGPYSIDQLRAHGPDLVVSDPAELVKSGYFSEILGPEG